LAASFDADAGAFAMTLKRSDSFAEGECIPFYKKHHWPYNRDLRLTRGR